MKDLTLVVILEPQSSSTNVIAEVNGHLLSKCNSFSVLIHLNENLLQNLVAGLIIY